MFVSTCDDTNGEYLCYYREEASVSARYLRAQRCDEIDARFGFSRHVNSDERLGWLINMHPVSDWHGRESQTSILRAFVDLCSAGC